jgi:HSP20 family protein
LVSKDLFPAVNVKDRESSYEIELTAPGLRKEDFNIHIENGVLTISSESSKEEEEKNEKFTRKEFRYNAFSRSFSLPDNAKEDDLKALYENGLLKVTIAKKQIESPKRKQIEVS